MHEIIAAHLNIFSRIVPMVPVHLIISKLHISCLSAENSSPFGDDQFTGKIEHKFQSVFGFKFSTMLPEDKDKIKSVTKTFPSNPAQT